VVVLTTSSSQDDIERMYGLQANCFVTKPIDLDEFFEIVHQIQGFWLRLVTLPKN
jgi:DNA-binding NarL/FixJ family response regulator